MSSSAACPFGPAVARDSPSNMHAGSLSSPRLPFAVLQHPSMDICCIGRDRTLLIAASNMHCSCRYMVYSFVMVDTAIWLTTQSQFYTDITLDYLCIQSVDLPFASIYMLKKKRKDNRFGPLRMGQSPVRLDVFCLLAHLAPEVCVNSIPT
jgi:hypothetical protein